MLKIESSAAQLVKDWNVPETLEFGKEISPIMVESNFKDDTWSAPKIVPYQNISISPAAKCFHYGQEIFEGMKGYLSPESKALLFRPDAHAERFNTSASRLQMPSFPKEFFLESVASITSHLSSKIPSHDGGALYIRPFMFSTEPGLKLSISREYKFMVLACPVSSYFTADKVSAIISRNQSRAAPGGTGNVKVAGNYAASLQAQNEAIRNGYSQILWLDAVSHSNIEEFSGMNFFAVIDGVLTTPELSGSILAGITRSSLLEIAEKIGIPTQQSQMKIDTVLSQIKSGSCSEIFACGTAAVVSNIDELHDLEMGAFSLSKEGQVIGPQLKKHLLEIQKGRSELFSEWSYRCV